MNNQFQEKIKNVLTVFADGAPRDVQDESIFNMNTITWLFENGYINGIDTSDKDGNSYLELKITEKGMNFLNQDEKEAKQRTTREADYQANHPIRATIVSAVIGSVFVAAILAYFGWIANK
jgi:hypothetical protein